MVWTFCILFSPYGNVIEKESGKGSPKKVDYRDELDTETFARFSILRKIRKRLAQDESVPAYAIFTDAELAEIAKLKTISREGMLKIPGIGTKKVEKYANAFVTDLMQEEDEKNRIFDGEDSGPL